MPRDTESAQSQFGARHDAQVALADMDERGASTLARAAAALLPRAALRRSPLDLDHAARSRLRPHAALLDAGALRLRRDPHSRAGAAARPGLAESADARRGLRRLRGGARRQHMVQPRRECRRARRLRARLGHQRRLGARADRLPRGDERLRPHRAGRGGLPAHRGASLAAAARLRPLQRPDRPRRHPRPARLGLPQRGRRATRTRRFPSTSSASRWCSSSSSSACASRRLSTDRPTRTRLPRHAASTGRRWRRCSPSSSCSTSSPG